MTIDRTSWWWRQGRTVFGIFATALIAGIILEPLQNAAWTVTRPNRPELNFKDLNDNLGQGTLLGVFGGFRNILADFAWLRGYSYWEQRDRPNTEAMLNLATTLDPRVIMFWKEGSRIIAYDIPTWFLHRDPPLPPEEYKKIHDEQARRGLEFLDRGLQLLPNNFSLLLNKAEIYRNRLIDEPGGIELAAEQYRLASEATKQFYFPLRQYLGLLWKLGDSQHQREAYTYLRQHYPTLPQDVPDAQISMMWDTIQQMEAALKIPADQRANFPKPKNYSTDPEIEPLPSVDLHEN
jgi:hypothetical protein